MQGFNPATQAVVPDPAEQVLLESGLPLPEAKKADTMPPGQGENILPHYQTFSMLVNSMSRTYRWTYDEALKHSQENALAIRRDPVIMDALRSRQIPVSQLPWRIEGDDDQDESTNEGIKRVTETIKAIPRLQQFMMHLEEAVWFGRYGVQTMNRWDYSTGIKQLRIRDHRPINGDKLVFRWGGEVGILVHAAYPGSWQVTDRGRAHFLTPEEREQLILHKFEPEDADFFEGELAGGINGVGIRSRVYWLWYLRQQVFSFLMDYLERVGAGGFTIYYYEMGNPASMAEVQQAAESQWRNNAILFPRYRDKTTQGPGVENVAVSMGGASLLQALVTEYFDTIIRRYILGQSLTSEQAGGGGLGDGVAGLHEDTFARIIKYDAVNLQETLTTDLVATIQKYNAPRIKKPLRFIFEVDKPNVKELLEAAQIFFEMGGTLEEDELRSVTGLTKPAPGSSMIAKFQSMSPASMTGQTPVGTPMLGQPGPEVPPQDPNQGQVPPQQEQSTIQMAKRGKVVKFQEKPLFIIKKRRSGDGLYHDIYVGRKRIGHIGGFEKDIGGKPVFDVTNTELHPDYRGTGLYGKAVQQVANTYPMGIRSAKFQSSKALTKSLKKLPTFKETESHLTIQPDNVQGVAPVQMARSSSHRVRLARPGFEHPSETPEAREAREAQEAWDRGEITHHRFLSKQAPGFKHEYKGLRFLNSFDRGPMVLGKLPVSAYQGSSIGQKKIYPKTLQMYQKFLEENPKEDTEPITAIGGHEGFSVYDGHHRITAYINAKRSHVPAWRPYNSEGSPKKEMK
jgi:Protein of unknown function (DUF935)